MSSRNVSTIRVYLTYMLFTTLVVLGFALFQHRFVLGYPLADIGLRILIVPGILGVGFGYLIATVTQLQRKQSRITEQLLEHDRTLQQELEERRRTELTLQRQTQELRAANQELESFGYAISHDLRAPLRRITGFSEALVEQCDNGESEPLQSLLNRIRHASEHMHEMIDDLLSLSRITGVQLQRTPVNLSSMAHEIIDDLRASEPDRRVDIDIQPGLIAHADAHLLRHVMENLISNAWKFTTREARPRIEIGGEYDQGKTIFFVRDNGVGFDPQYADQMFLPFKRLHKDSDFEGSGIGLATVQRIVQRHGGWVRAEGEIDTGSNISFYLNGGNLRQAAMA